MRSNLLRGKRVRHPEADALFIHAILEPEGYDVISVTEADILETAMRESPDCIVVESIDKMLDPLKKLRGHVRYLYTPVFVLFDIVDKGNEGKGKEIGISGFIYRPLDRQKVLSLVRREEGNV